MNLRALFKSLLPFIRPYRLLILGTLILTFIGASLAQINALVIRYAVDNLSDLLNAGASFEAGIGLLITISIILLGKELIGALVEFGQKFFGEQLRINISKDLVEAIVAKVLTYRLTFFTESDNESGRLQTRIDRGVTSITRLVQYFFINILPILLSSLMALILMFNANIYVGLLGISVIPAYYYISVKQGDKLKGWRRRIRGFRESQNQGIVSIINSITVIKSFNRESIECDKQFALQDELRENEMSMRRVAYLFDSLKSFVDQIGIVLIIILSSFLVLKGWMSLGSIMFNIMLFANVSAPIRQLQRIYNEMSEAVIYAEGYFDILHADKEQEPTGDYCEGRAQGNFSIRQLSFQYPDGTDALHNVNMEIEAGKITALVGLSGAGKSTLISLLDRFYEPNSGEIILDGIPLQQYDTQFLRDNIGLVLQKNHIFSGTIEENIRYGNIDASFDEIVTASKQAYIHDQIMAMPNGYATKALALSGGQQQRIAIARMFLKDPPIIFLDEPTASLDAIATEQIKNSIDAIKQNRTVIIISHSISQIIDADYIYVMEEGTIVEEGTHEEIYALEGSYRTIFDAMARTLNLDKIVDATAHGNHTRHHPSPDSLGSN